MRPVLLLLSLLLFLRSPSPAQTFPSDSLKDVLVSTQNDSLKSDAFHRLFQASMMQSFDSARKYSLAFVAFVEENSYPPGKMFAYLDLATTYAIRGSFDTAIHHFHQARTLAMHLGKKSELAKSHLSLGNCFLRLGNLDSSLNYFQLALEAYKEIENVDGQAAVNNNMGFLYESKKELSKALSHYLHSLSLRKTHGPEAKLSFNFSRIGNIHLQQGDLDSALYYYEKYLANAQKYEQQKEIAAAESNLGNVYLEQGNFERALAHYQSSLKLFQVFGDKYHIAYLHNNLAKAFVNLGQYEQALSHSERALSMAKEQDVLSLQKEAHETRLAVFAGRKDYRAQLAALEALTQVKDSMILRENTANLSELELKYETKEKEAQLSAQKLALLEEELLRNRILIFSSLILLLFLALIGWLIFRYRNRRRKMEHIMELKQTESENLRILNQLKSRFFANISHEFRTPLTLILGPVSQLLKDYRKGELGQELSLVQKNARRLEVLVGQLMDLAKLESGKMELNLQRGDVFAFIRGIAHSFSSMADLKEIHFDIHVPEGECMTAFDPDKLQSILSNLLSNAIKYTEEEGWVEMEVQLNAPDQLGIEVKDNGIGIKATDLPQIFDRFYRVEGSEIEGSGIGLALTRELVHLMGGEIEVESEWNQGSSFRVEIPLRDAEGAIPAYKFPQEFAETEASMLPVIPQTTAERASILLVEDNADVRRFIKQQLEQAYQIWEVENGVEGLAFLDRKLPDLILSDVMMPKMDGITFTHKVKTQEISSHIPVIMLTAKGDRSSKLEGLETGADDYLSKPFDADELKLRIRNLIEQRRKLREHFQKPGILDWEGTKENSLDEAFLNRLRALIEAEIGNEELSIESLSEGLGISRGHLHKKLKALTNMSPSVFLRTLRLQKAKRMLEQGVGTAAEISFRCGFSSPAYFSKCFKDQFGLAPGMVKPNSLS